MTLEALDRKTWPSITPLPRRFVHASYGAAARAILEATKQGPGLVLLTGASGTGKTTLAEDLAEQFERDGCYVAWVTMSREAAEDLLQLVSLAFGLEADSFSRTRLLSDLADRIASRCRPDKPAILIIDGAQDLAPRALPELCYLGGLTGSKIHPVQILLSGRDQVWELLDRPDHATIRQRILATCRIFPLTLEETASYLAHVLEPAGWQDGDPEISADAVRLVYERTGGVPRLISLTLGHLLLHGRQSGARVLESRDVEWVLAHPGKDAPAYLAGSTRTLHLTERAHPQPPSSPNVGELPTSKERKPSPEQRSSSRKNGLTAGDTLAGLRGLLQRIGSWDRRWVLSGLVAAALVASFVVYLVGSGDDTLQTPEIAEPSRWEASPVVASAGMERPIAEPTRPALTPTAADIGVTAAPRDGSDAGKPRIASGRVDPTIAGIEGMGIENPEVLAQSQAGTPEIPGGIMDTASPVTVGTADQDRQAMQSPEIDRLLTNAELALSNDRLMFPADDNAYGYYQDVLALDPSNDRARAGIQRIVKRYGELAGQSLRNGNRAAAARFVSRGLTLEPTDRDLLLIQRQASRPRVKKAQGKAPKAAATEQEAPTALDLIEGWLRSGRTDQSHFLDH
ncbi:ExeA family protein [Thiocapsa roseopersicina]|uniref:Type II secretory pathway, component ExeA (Predicted ATPase) n=1 Tax=Thiocapsa roseopersicina TaxID=1058 RepID=A0A1H3D9V8_THIRO|nr:AAA family ATPase [Thiocapsa roseopersicina]SDX63181.1 Type II secretory pathway, component ExeA (predicted ATPase) [Thiocapsa roseopersicina]